MARSARFSCGSTTKHRASKNVAALKAPQVGRLRFEPVVGPKQSSSLKTRGSGGLLLEPRRRWGRELVGPPVVARQRHASRGQEAHDQRYRGAGDRGAVLVGREAFGHHG